MDLRLATIDDVPHLRRMLDANVEENGDGSFLAPVSDEDLLLDIVRGGVVVADTESKAPCAMGCVRVDGERWYVYGVYAEPRMRGLGVGREIVARLHEIAKSQGATKGFAVGNDFMERIFSNAGYRAVGKLMERA